MTAFSPLTPWKRLVKLLSADKRDVGYIFLFAIFNGLIALSLPLGIQAILNLIMTGQVSTSWWILIFVVVFGIAMSGWFQVLQMSVIESIQQRIFTRASFEFAYRIPRFKMEALAKHDAPELVNRFFDTLTIQKGLPKLFIDFSSSLVNIVFGLVLLSFYHPFFVLFGLATLILLYLVFRYTFPRGLQTSLGESKYKYRTVHWLEEVAHSLYTFKLAGRTLLPLRRTDDLTNAYLDNRQSHFRILILQYGALVVFKVLITASLLIMGGYLVMDRQLSIGQFVAGEIVIVLIMNAAEKFTLVMDSLYDTLTGLEKIGAVTDLELESDHAFPEHENKGPFSLETDAFIFHPPLAGEVQLHIPELLINPGEKWLIAGPNGSGKSAFLQMVAGLYSAPEGAIRIDGKPIGAWNLSELRLRMGDNFNQEAFFSGTLMENLGLGRDGVEEKQVIEYLKALGVMRFVNRLPQGIYTHVGPETRNWPRSVVQRMMLVRSLAAQPAMLLLDDPTVGLDPIHRHEVIELITKHYQGTLLVTSRDPWLVDQVDQLILMEEGVVVARGKGADLKSHEVFNKVFYPERPC